MKVKTKNPDRGPLLIISGEPTTPSRGRSPTRRSSAQRRNDGVTEIVKVKGRGHSLTIDHGWKKVADTSLKFIQRFVKP